jgi:hypothetical protein
MKMPATATIAALTLAPWVELISFVITLLEEQRKNIVDEICNHVLLLLLTCSLCKLKGTFVPIGAMTLGIMTLGLMASCYTHNIYLKWNNAFYQ